MSYIKILLKNLENNIIVFYFKIILFLYNLFTYKITEIISSRKKAIVQKNIFINYPIKRIRYEIHLEMQEKLTN